MCKKNKKDFLRRGFHLCNKFMLCVLNKINTTIHDPFFISKSSMLNIYIYIRSTSNENVDQFLIRKKCKSASKEDANPFLF